MIPAIEAQLRPLIDQVAANARKALMFGCWGAAGGGVGSLLVDGFGNAHGGFFLNLITAGIWFGIIGGFISTALLIGNSTYLNRGPQFVRAFKAGFRGGAKAGLVSGMIAQLIFSTFGSDEGLRLLCWGLAGALLGGGLSKHVPNLERKYGMIGGFIGGTIGCILFIFFAALFAQTLGRFFGVVSIGFFIGLMIAIVEAVFRKKWVEVTIAGVKHTITLGDQPVTIGSDANAATVQVPGLAGIAGAFSLQSDQIFYQDFVTGITRPVRVGEEEILGNVTIAPCSRTQLKSAPVFTSGVPNTSSPARLRLHLPGQTFRLVASDRIEYTSLSARGSRDPELLGEVNPVLNGQGGSSLRNVSREDWTVTAPDGTARLIQPGQSVRVVAGTQIDFGRMTGDIRGE